MGRNKHVVKSGKVTITVSAETLKILKTLTELGLWGKSIPETAEEMVRRGIKHETQGDSLGVLKLRKLLQDEI